MILGKKTFFLLLVFVVILAGCAGSGNSQSLSGRARPVFRDAQIFLQQSNYERALEYYLLVLEHDPDHVISMKNVADLYFMQADLQEEEMAIQTFEIAHGYYLLTLSTIASIPNWTGFTGFEVIKNDSELKLASIFARNFRIGQEFFHEDDFESAESIFQDLLSLFPERTESYQMLAAIADRLGNLEKTIEYSLKILEVDPTNTQILINLALEYQGKGDLENAAKYFRMYIDVEPNNASGYVSLAYIYMQMEDFDTALLLYEQAMQVDPDNVDIVADAANIAQEAQNESKTVLYLKRLIELERTEENVSYLVVHLMRVQNWAEVIVYAKIWHELDPDAKEPVQLIILAAGQTGDNDTAREYQNILNKME